MSILHRDYETRSTLDLRRVGAWRNAAHPGTSILCCAYAADDAPVKLWILGDPVPAEFIEAAQNPDWIVSAFNDNFERQIEAHIISPRYGWPTIPIERHRCTQASALTLALPASLDAVATALGLAEQKDRAGHANMLAMSRPRKPRKGEDPAGVYWHDDPVRLERLYAYCRQDIEVERAVYARIGHISPKEQAIWELDAAINDRGVYVDGRLAGAAIQIGISARDEINAELQALTLGEIATIDQTAKLIAWLGARGCEVKDVQKETLRRALTRKDISKEARRVMELRRDGAHASANKFQTMLNWRNGNGRIRGAFRYHGASTGRWTSLGVQLQNLKRPGVADLQAAIDAVAAGNLAKLKTVYPQPMSIAGDIARAAFCAAPGQRLVIADFSGIESRVLAWLSGQPSKLAQWMKFDQTGDPQDDPYCVLGTACRLPAEQVRPKGKIIDLAFGFQGGKGAYRALAPDDPATDEEIKRYQTAWHRAHPMTVRFWGDINRAAITAAQHPGKTFEVNRRISFEYDGTFLRMRLPNERKLAYPFPRLKTTDRGELAVIYKDNQLGKWVDCNHGRGAYGGIWTENAVSATARDLFAAAMLRLEAAGYPIVMHVHDEIVAEAPIGFGSAEEFQQIIVAPPEWAGGLPIAAKVDERERFCKIAPREPDSPEIPAEPANTYGPPPNTYNAANNTDGDTSMHDNNYSPESKRPFGRIEKFYFYLDQHGANYGRVTRTSTKRFFQARWENGKWMNKAPKPKIPYRLPELIASPISEPVFICEGEKDAESVAGLGLVATSNPGGGIKGSWTSDLNKWFAGRTIYIMEDNDSTGRAHASAVADALRGTGAEIRIVSFPELPENGDISDWIEWGGTKEQLIARAKAGRVPDDGFELIRASSRRPKNIDWLWEGHLPTDEVEILAGLPGAGKSQIQDGYVACVTTGIAWPDGANGQGRRSVIMLTAEDTLDSILMPRLIAAGADLDRVYIFGWVRQDDKKRMFLLAEDLSKLEKAIAKTGDVGLVTIDPITAYMGGKIDSHRATDVRNQLGPLKDLAERHSVGISIVTHPAKNAGPRALDQFLGSQAFIAVPRVGHLCIDEIEQNEAGVRQPTGRTLYTQPKLTVSKKQLSLAYRITDASAGIDYRTGREIKTSKIAWEGPVDVTADEALAATATKRDHSGVVMFLMDMLSNGPVPKSLIDTRAQARGFSDDQLRHAKSKMGIDAYKEQKFQGAWFWCLPQHNPQQTKPENDARV